MQLTYRALELCRQQMKVMFKSHAGIHFKNTLLPFRSFSIVTQSNFLGHNHEVLSPRTSWSVTDEKAIQVQNFLKHNVYKKFDEIEKGLNQCDLFLNEDLVLNVLRRHRSDWKPAHIFFNWVTRARNASGFLPGSDSYNEILDILGRMKRFQEMTQLLDEMSERKGVFNERTYGIVVRRYAAAHKTEEATEFFYKRREFGLELDSIAFQTLLYSLCWHKHVEAAEVLFHSKKNEFGHHNIKTMNIILNGWCVLGNFREAKRFLNDIVTSRCKPDKFTCGIFINSLSKAGKITTAMKLFQGMWAEGCNLDIGMCNRIIDGLCIKKRIPEALEIFYLMNDKGCPPNVVTYNLLIKHLCKIQRMEKVYELFHEMEQKGECCLPDARTYGYLLNYAKNPDEVLEIMGSMEQVGCKMTADTYNLVLRLFMGWDYEEKVKYIWTEMEKSGLGPDQRSYRIMVRGHYYKGRMKEAMSYFHEMTLKGMVPRTELLMNAINFKLNDREDERKKLRRSRMNAINFKLNDREVERKKLRRSRRHWSSFIVFQ